MNRLTLLAMAALVCSGSALAQGTAGGTGAGGSSGAAGSSSAGQAGGSGAATSKSAAGQGSGSGSKSTSGSAGGGASLAKADSKMLTDLAEANIAEIETGKLALQKAQSEPAKTFAQKMIDDHTAALQQLQTLAQSKGVDLPKEADVQHKAMAKALGAMKGDTFDAQYLKRVGVNDHQRTAQLLQKAQKQAKDPELKAMATKMLPTVQQHLQMAQQHVGGGAKTAQTAKQ